MELADLKAKLDAANGQALRDAERKALTAMGKLVQGAISEKAPERTKYDGGDLKPGELKAGFKVSVHIASDSATINSSDNSRVTIAPKADIAHVARFVEDGHANPPGSKTENTPGHPYVRPAFEETQEQAVEIYVSTLTEALQKALDAE